MLARAPMILPAANITNAPVILPAAVTGYTSP
jgi:hypothetical protein